MDNQAQISSKLIQEPINQQPIKQNSIYKEQSYRFINLALILMIYILSILPYQTFTAINNQISHIYGYSKILITLNSLLFALVHPTLAFITNWVLDKYGLKIGFLCSSIFCIIGTWIRELIGVSIYFCLFGSFLTAFGTIFIVNSPTKFANSWFRPALVPTVISIIIIVGHFGTPFSIIFSTFFINQKSNSSDVKYMLMIQAIIITIIMLVFMIFYKSNPKVPPSFTSAAKNPFKNYRQQIRTLFTNKNYIFLLISSSLCYSTLIAIITDIQYALKPFFPQKTSKIASQSLFFACLFGFFGSIIFTYVLKKTNKYKSILLFLMSATVITFMLFILALKSQILWLTYIMIILVAFFILPTTPIFFQFGCELSFPVGQATSSGYLYAFGQIFGFGVGLGLVSYLDGISKWRSYICCMILVFLNLIGIVFIYILQEDLRRSRYEQEHIRLNEKEQSDILTDASFKQ